MHSSRWMEPWGFTKRSNVAEQRIRPGEACFLIVVSPVEELVATMQLANLGMTLLDISSIWEKEWGVRHVDRIKFKTVIDPRSRWLKQTTDVVLVSEDIVELECKAQSVLQELIRAFKRNGGTVVDRLADQRKHWYLKQATRARKIEFEIADELKLPPEVLEQRKRDAKKKEERECMLVFAKMEEEERLKEQEDAKFRIAQEDERQRVEERARAIEAQKKIEEQEREQKRKKREEWENRKDTEEQRQRRKNREARMRKNQDRLLARQNLDVQRHSDSSEMSTCD